MAVLPDFPPVAGAGVGVYYWDGSAWQRWTGSPIVPTAQLYAWTGAAWVAVAASAGGLLQIAPLPTGSNVIGKIDINSAPTVVVQSTNSDKVFGLESPIDARAINLNLPAGASEISTSAVPAGKVWVIGFAAVYCASATATLLYAYVNSALGTPTILREPTVVSGKLYTAIGRWILGPGDKLTAGIVGATLNDDLILESNGYQMDST